MAKSLYAQQAGGGNIDALIKLLMGGQTPEEKEIQALRLKSLKGGNFGEIEKRLDAYSSTEDITTSKGIEKVSAKIETALTSGKFGNEVEVTDYVKNYIGALTQSGVSQTTLATDRKNLYTLTNPSNIKKILTEAQVEGDTTKAVANLENYVVNLSVARNKVADIPGARSKLSPHLSSRFTTAQEQLYTALTDMTGGKFTEKDLGRIMKGTYATMVLADANLEAKEKELEFVKEFKDPTRQESQYLSILQDIESAVNEYDDKLNFEVQKHSFLDMSEELYPSGAGPTPEYEKSQGDLSLLAGFRQARLIGRYSQQYKDAYNSLKALRKKYPKKMGYVDFDEIMNKKVHNELYNYVPPEIDDGNGDGNGGANGNKGTASFSPPNESNLINNMLKNRTITFTKDIFDSSGKVWKQEGESIKGLGNPGTGTWKIKKDGIKRDEDNNLISLNLDLPTADWPTAYNLRPEVYMRGSVSLKPEDFVIEDSPYLSGVGYQHKKNGLFSYNIYNNSYELIQK